MTEAISLTESKQLVSLEKTIEAGQKTFVEVGLALAEIRASRLYRADHSTFEEYCHSKWGWSRVHVHRVIDAAETVGMLPMGNKSQVTSERQARELSKASPAKRAEVLEAVAAKGPVTAKAIREEIQEAVEVKPPTIDDRWKNAAGQPESWGPGGAPIKPADHAPEDDESDALFGLKRYWKKANKKERKEFLTWIKQ